MENKQFLSKAGVQLLAEEIKKNRKFTKITWAALKTLRDGASLNPGTFYQITDYTCTTTQDSTQSASHNFDIVVQALSNSILSEKAEAMVHEGDEYFVGSNLSAWQLWYDLDNDTTKYSWADATNGKGVIYRMIDEFGNDCPYDFKNIQFKRYWANGTSVNGTAILQGYFAHDNNQSKFTNGVNTARIAWCYTFNRIDNTENDYSSVYDASLKPTASANQCMNNIIGRNGSGTAISLNNIVFLNNSSDYTCSGNSFGDNCSYNSFGDNCSNNSFGSNCGYNSFGHKCLGDSCSNNSFGNFCRSNSFSDSCSNNSFGNFCDNNSFGDNCSNNSFGSNCGYNSFGDKCSNNSFNGTFCSNNSFGDNCSNNIFSGSSCKDNSFGNACGSNNLRSDCSNNSFGNSCYHNVFSTNCKNNSLGNSCKDNSFGSDCSNNSLGNSCSNNVFGIRCVSNSFNNNCEYNSFGDDCGYNSFGNKCGFSNFGNYYYSNSLGNSCSNNVFGNYCHNNSFGNNCSYNSFGNGVNKRDVKYDFVSEVKFDDGVSYVNLKPSFTVSKSQYMCNIRVLRGVHGATKTKSNTGIYSWNYASDGSDRLNVVIDTFSQDYELCVGMTKTGELEIWTNEPTDIPEITADEINTLIP